METQLLPAEAAGQQVGFFHSPLFQALQLDGRRHGLIIEKTLEPNGKLGYA